jgi:glycine cleavage system H protein
MISSTYRMSGLTRGVVGDLRYGVLRLPLLRHHLAMAQLRFSGAHVWVRVEGSEAVLGLSDYLQDQMGEITTLELPDLGDVLRAKRRMGHVESEEASSPIEAPISGEVIEVNAEALENPDIVNTEPYATGWLLRVRIDDPSELEELISEEEYADLTTEV